MQKIGTLISESKSSRSIVVEKDGLRGELTITTSVLSFKAEEEETFILRNLSMRLCKKLDL